MINAEFDIESGQFIPIDPSLPLWCNTEELWIDDPELPQNLYCEEKDFD